VSESDIWPSSDSRPALSSDRPPGLKKKSVDDRAVALIPAGGSFEGQVALQGETRVEGAVRGSLRGSGELVLGPDARIEGIVECDVVSSSGAIIGPVAARVGAHFADGAYFDGDLEAPSVEIEGDVIWNGVARVGG
jgi:cytoskeletal protein CcmA (bactofilin family)